MQEVFFVSGQAASGKSQFSRALAANRNLTIIDFDDTLEETKAKHQQLLSEVGMEKFLSQVSLERYDDLMNRAFKEFSLGKSIVIEAPFTRHIADIDLWQKTVEPFVEAGVNPRLCWVSVTPEVRKQRLLDRASERDREKIEKVDEYIAMNPTTPPKVEHFAINGQENFTQFVKDNF